VATAAAAKHIFVSESRFHQQVNAGTFERAKTRGGYDLDVIREIAFKTLRAEIHRRGDNAPGLTEERTRHARAVANITERKDQAGAGKLVDVDRLVILHNVERSVVREKLLSLGPELQGDLGVEGAALVDSKCREALLELSDANSLMRRAARVDAGLGDLHDAAVAARKKDGDEDEDEDEDA